MSFDIIKVVSAPLIITDGLVPRGEYDNSTAYQVGDSVSYEGSSYICYVDSTGNLPTDTAYWQIIAQGSGGDSGDAIAYAIALG